MQKSPLEQKKKFPCEEPREAGSKAKWAREIDIWKTIRWVWLYHVFQLISTKHKVISMDMLHG